MPYNFDDYLNTVKQNIKNKKLHAPICAELESHLQDAADFYVEIGYDEETANQKALEDMGEPATVGENMAKLHKLSVGQVITEALFVLFVFLKIFETCYFSLFSGVIGQGRMLVEEFVIMLFVVFVGFFLSLWHKRIFPAATAIIYFFVGILSTISFFRAIISQLTGQWESYQTEMDLGLYPLNFNRSTFAISAVLAVLVTSLLFWVFNQIRKSITSATVKTSVFKKKFYGISILFLCVVLALTVATKTYLHQIDLEEKAEFERVLSDLCDYCLEKEKITKDDIPDVIAHFDYLDFKEYDDTKNYFSERYYSEYYLSASIGGKSLAHPSLSISVNTSGRFTINVSYHKLYNYQSYFPVLLLRVPYYNSVFRDNLRSGNIYAGIEEGDDSSEFTDVVKKYALQFTYTYDSERDEVYLTAFVGEDWHQNFGRSSVDVDSGKITGLGISDNRA